MAIDQQTEALLSYNAGDPEMVRRIVQERGLSQQDVAQALNISQQAAARYGMNPDQGMEETTIPMEQRQAIGQPAASGAAGGVPVKPGSLGNLPNQEGRSVASGADIMRGGPPGGLQPAVFEQQFAPSREMQAQQMATGGNMTREMNANLAEVGGGNFYAINHPTMGGFELAIGGGNMQGGGNMPPPPRTGGNIEPTAAPKPVQGGGNMEPTAAPKPTVQSTGNVGFRGPAPLEGMKPMTETIAQKPVAPKPAQRPPAGAAQAFRQARAGLSGGLGGAAEQAFVSGFNRARGNLR